MDLLPDTDNCGLRVRREYRERFPRRRLQRKPLFSDHGTCATHVQWCMSGSLTHGGGKNVPSIPGACAPATLCIWQEAHGLKCITYSDLVGTQDRLKSRGFFLDVAITSHCLGALSQIRVSRHYVIGGKRDLVWHDRLPWWRHQMETFSMLLAICAGNSPGTAGNSPVPGEFPAQRPVTRSLLMFSLICARINGKVNKGEAGDLRRYRALYDVIVMTLVGVAISFSVKNTFPNTLTLTDQCRINRIMHQGSCSVVAWCGQILAELSISFRVTSLALRHTTIELLHCLIIRPWKWIMNHTYPLKQLINQNKIKRDKTVWIIMGYK